MIQLLISYTSWEFGLYKNKLKKSKIQETIYQNYEQTFRKKSPVILPIVASGFSGGVIMWISTHKRSTIVGTGKFAVDNSTWRVSVYGN